PVFRFIGLARLNALHPLRQALLLVVRVQIFQPSETDGGACRRAGVVVKAAADVVPRAVSLAAEDNVGRGLANSIKLLISLREIAVELLQGKRFLFKLLCALCYALFEFQVQTLKLALLTMEFSKNPDFRPKHVGNDRHRKIIYSAMLVSLEPVDIGEMNGGNKNDRRLLKTRMLPDDLGKFEAVDLRHADIHQDGRYVSLQQLLKRVLGRVCLDQVFAEFSEDGLIAEQFARLVVDHQNVYFVVGLHRLISILPRRINA